MKNEWVAHMAQYLSIFPFSVGCQMPRANRICPKIDYIHLTCIVLYCVRVFLRVPTHSAVRHPLIKKRGPAALLTKSTPTIRTATLVSLYILGGNSS